LAGAVGLPFVFVVSNLASTPLAKAEVLERTPGARFAFSRPGLVTFRLAEASPEFGGGLIFARVAGQSLGRAETLDEALALVPSDTACVHVFARDPEHAPSVARAAALRASLAAQRVRVPRDGEPVLDVVVAEGEPLFVGMHTHGAHRWAVAGGLPDVVVPPEAPSRSFAKLEEALAWSGLRPREGAHVVELGSAPGGATLACLRRGLRVTAFDPADMDPAVLDYEGRGGARVSFHQKPAGSVSREDLPRDARLLVVDMNLAPPVALRYARRVRAMLPALEAAIFTVKLNDERMIAQASRWVELVRSMDFREVRATQLASHRQEMVIVAR
jgi:23S rRNA (cytidine2498-2'-O)-methyltransferase